MCHAGDTGDLRGAAVLEVIAISWAKLLGDLGHLSWRDISWGH